MSSMFDRYYLLVFAIHAVVLITVIPLHEFAHGFVAYKLGDSTANERGRLTLNPLAHLDLVGTLAMLFFGFGWAKPVPVNPKKFKNPRGGLALSALAGPLANILFALLILSFYKIIASTGFFYNGRNGDFSSSVYFILTTMIQLSLYLAVFNLLPFPPLDGFNIFGILLPPAAYHFIMRYQIYIMLTLIALLTYTDVAIVPITWTANQILSLLDLITTPLNYL